jgi:hypothetical protein
MRCLVMVRERRRQKSRNPSRCHRRRVSGCTMARARRQRGKTAAATRSRIRSDLVSLGRGDFLRKTMICCLRITFSRMSSLRLRTTSTTAPAATLPCSAGGERFQEAAPTGADPGDDVMQKLHCPIFAHARGRRVTRIDLRDRGVVSRGSPR